MNSYQEIKQDLIEECQEDFVGLWEIINKMKRGYPEATSEEIRKKSMQLVRDLLEEGIRAGYFSGKRVHKTELDSNEIYVRDIRDRDYYFLFEFWDMKIEDIIKRIEREWDELGREPDIEDIVEFIAEG